MPFNLLYKAFTSSFRLFSYLFPFLPRLFSRSGTLHGRTAKTRNTAGRRTLSPRDTATRFIREFEEEYGTTDFPFLENGYAQSLDLAKKDLKFLLVILCSVEHDDTQSFIRKTLLAPEVSGFVKNPQNNIIVWGGSVQDSEAYQVSNALNCSKFPFSAMISLVPQSSTTAMQIIVRIPGPVSPSTFVAKLQSAISEHSEALETVRSTRAVQNAERNLREEQNSAYERSLAVDRERARIKREAEAKKAREEKESQDREKAALELQGKIESWRAWRSSRLLPEPRPDEKDVVRISLRTPSGERVVRKFKADAAMEELYAFIECKEALDRSTGSSPSEPADYDHTYGFRLVSPMPRTVYEVDSSGTLKDQIGRSGNLIVEEIVDEEYEE
jgi:FAS-associated factor 2